MHMNGAVENISHKLCEGVDVFVDFDTGVLYIYIYT